ncbi:hypothetical protein SAMN02745164_01464 [Marinitoga hydrogenitolerans DSM 16785]|uniref:Uncharacterized protein n=1 Tax=Marinitoga hydrogenitolerans (strain DSM 16785 / JCM 12826 / AT1271) TaxID=1122195 RepID=A0A1M4XLB7_MARH1|nr:hypothetical protein [Marinitoga hydrogenitolerans]SHE94387.1 hypothetical protein SAMN02745164_01464 [Marinitoga hydrogenitolerans DSM 16785]
MLYFWYLLFECFIASFIAFFVAQYYIITNKKFPYIFELMNLYNFVVLILFIKIMSIEYLKFANFLFFITLIIFYVRSYLTAKDKFDSRFRSMILSFGYTRESYFYKFLMKRILLRGLEGFSFSIALILLVNKIPFWFNIRNNINEFFYIILFLLGAGIVKTTNFGRISRT